MNKILIIIFTVGIVALGIGGFLLLSRDQKKANNTSVQQTAQTPTTTPNNAVTYDGKTFTPSKVNVSKGGSVSVYNLSDKDVNIEIVGKKASPVIHVQANNSNTYPNIQLEGTYTFKDITNETKIKPASNSGPEK